MNFQRRKKEKVDISLTPMIDAVFLLLIFFMVTTTFNRETEIKIKLPEAAGSEKVTETKRIALIINAQGEFLVVDGNGQSHTLNSQSPRGLQHALSELPSDQREMPFVINADAKTPHQAVMTALDIAAQFGFSHITFAAKAPNDSSDANAVK